MVGIVIVSHSYRIAEGVAELAREMGGPDVRLETAGGLDTPDHPIGTDAVLVMQAVDRAWSDDGVLVLMDLGSAVLSAEMALDLMPEESARAGAPVRGPARRGRRGRRRHREDGRHARGGGHRGPRRSRREDRAPRHPRTGGGRARRGRRGRRHAAAHDRNPHGLHARPAARFVQTASGFDAKIEVRNLTSGRGPADAASLNAVATLGAAAGHEIEVAAGGPQAAEAIAAIRALAARAFDEAVEAPGAPEVPAPDTAPGAAPPAEGVVRGFAASPGIAIGAVRRCHVPSLEIDRDDATDPDAEAAALDAAIADTVDAVRRQREAVAARAGEAEAGIFDAHLLFLRDEALLAPADARSTPTVARPPAPGATRSIAPLPPGTASRTSTCAPGPTTCGAWAPRCSRACSGSRRPTRGSRRPACSWPPTSRPPTPPDSTPPSCGGSRPPAAAPPRTQRSSRARSGSRRSSGWATPPSISTRGRPLRWTDAWATCTSTPPPTTWRGSRPRRPRCRRHARRRARARAVPRSRATASRWRSPRTWAALRKSPPPWRRGPTGSGSSARSSSSWGATGCPTRTSRRRRTARPPRLSTAGRC